MNNYSNINKQKNKAKLLYQNKRYYEAEKIYNEVLTKSNKREKFALYGLAKIKIEQKKFKEAESLLNEAIILYPGNFKAIFILGKLYVSENKYEEAEHLFKECIKLNPNYYDSKIELGKLYVSENKYKEAKELFNECINLNSNRINARLELGKLYVLENKYKEAEKLFEECIKLYPNHYYSRIKLADLYIKEKKYEEVEVLLKKCMSLDSKGIISVVKLANLYIIQKEYSKAEKLILDSEENDLLLEELATVYMKTGKEEEAHKIYNKLYDLSSENNIFNYNNRVIHIKKHEKNNLSKDIHGVFNYDAEMLLDYAMKNKKEKITRYTEDIYQIPYKNCGYQGGKYGDGHSYDYITLVLFPETENIITMFPSDKKFD